MKTESDSSPTVTDFQYVQNLVRPLVDWRPHISWVSLRQ